jgi:hypothetical protein
MFYVIYLVAIFIGIGLSEMIFRVIKKYDWIPPNDTGKARTYRKR